MENPISQNLRGHIYVAGIVIGAVCLVAVAVLQVMDLPEWTPVVAAVSSVSGTLTATLSRANLSNPFLNDGEVVYHGEDA